jgi:6-phosphogluconolactonase (cycloisomerase 2 family)
MSHHDNTTAYVYVGCYTDDMKGEGDGVTVFRRDHATGWLEPVAEPIAIASPSCLTWHPSRHFLYAVNEGGGAVTALAIEGDGALRVLDERPTGGVWPCHLAVDPSGRWLVTANYGTGSLAVHHIGADGALGESTDLVQHHGAGPDPERQDGPHAHMVYFEPSGMMHAVDLGTDRIVHYDLDDAAGRLVVRGASELPAGTGPRHLVRHSSGSLLVVGELDSSVSVLRPDAAAGTWRVHLRVPATATPDDTPNLPAAIALSPDERFLYVSNRGRDSVTVFALDGDEPRPLLDVPCGGQWPRDLTLVEGHLYVANERSGSVVGFVIDPDTGVPHSPGLTITTPSPTFVLA